VPPVRHDADEICLHVAALSRGIEIPRQARDDTNQRVPYVVATPHYS
jgi:hypothetical protein